jgi:hypothetical protein
MNFNIQSLNSKAMKRFFQNICLVAVAVVLAVGANAQNLAGVDFTTTMGQPDNTLGCPKNTGDNGTVRAFRDGVSGACPDKPCFNQNLGCGSYCNFDEFGFKNIVNLDVCITVNISAGSCGFGIFSQAYGSPYVIPVTGTWCDNNDHISDAGSSGSGSYSFEAAGCTPFYIVNAPVVISAACDYTMTIDPDPILDLRCADEPMCVEKVIIGGTPVPTMTQWGLFLFGLIVLTLGVVTIYNMSTSRVSERS